MTGELAGHGHENRPGGHGVRKVGGLAFSGAEAHEAVLINRGVGVVIHIAADDEFLFYRRDDKPGINAPGMIDVIGGNMEEGETPEEALTREVGEELVDEGGAPFHLDEIEHYETFTNDATGEHNIFSAELPELPALRLTEGQGLVLLTREGVEQTEFAHGFTRVVRECVRQIN